MFVFIFIRLFPDFPFSANICNSSSSVGTCEPKKRIFLFCFAVSIFLYYKKICILVHLENHYDDPLYNCYNDDDDDENIFSLSLSSFFHNNDFHQPLSSLWWTLNQKRKKTKIFFSSKYITNNNHWIRICDRHAAAGFAFLHHHFIHFIPSSTIVNQAEIEYPRNLCGVREAFDSLFEKKKFDDQIFS